MVMYPNGTLTMLRTLTCHGRKIGSSAPLYGGLASTIFHPGQYLPLALRNARFISNAGFERFSAIPNGYNEDGSWCRPLISGGIASTQGVNGSGSISAPIISGFKLDSDLNGSGSVVSNMIGIAIIQASIDGSSGVIANIIGGVYLGSSLNGSGAINALLELKAILSSNISGEGNITANPSMVLFLVSSISGEGSLSPLFLSLGSGIGSLLMGEGDIDGYPNALASLIADISIGAKPSPEEVAAAVWNAIASGYVIPGSMGYLQGQSCPSPEDMASAVWEELSSGHVTPGSMGSLQNLISDVFSKVGRALGLIHENIYIDSTVYDSEGQLTSARVRLFSTKADVELATDGGTSPPDPIPIAVYTVTTTWNEPGQYRDFKQVLES